MQAILTDAPIKHELEARLENLSGAAIAFVKEQKTRLITRLLDPIGRQPLGHPRLLVHEGKTDDVALGKLSKTLVDQVKILSRRLGNDRSRQKSRKRTLTDAMGTLN
jgi:hypothetical protein